MRRPQRGDARQQPTDNIKSEKYFNESLLEIKCKQLVAVAGSVRLTWLRWFTRVARSGPQLSSAFFGKCCSSSSMAIYNEYYFSFCSTALCKRSEMTAASAAAVVVVSIMPQLWSLARRKFQWPWQGPSKPKAAAVAEIGKWRQRDRESHRRERQKGEWEPQCES